jgi:hypothetical protein
MWSPLPNFGFVGQIDEFRPGNAVTETVSQEAPATSVTFESESSRMATSGRSEG